MGGEVYDDSLVDEMDTTGITADELDSGGGINKEGWAHFLITDVVAFNKEDELPNIKFTCQCLAHVDPGQVDKNLYHRIYRKAWAKKGDKSEGMTEISEGAKKMTSLFARGLGLITNEQIGQKVKINWGLASGKQFCCKVDKEERKDKDGKVKKGEFDYRIPFGRVYPVDHEEASECPKSAEHLALAGLTGSGGTDDVI